MHPYVTTASSQFATFQDDLLNQRNKAFRQGLLQIFWSMAVNLRVHAIRMSFNVNIAYGWCQTIVYCFWLRYYFIVEVRKISKCSAAKQFSSVNLGNPVYIIGM